jgi:hypothetical protein
MARSATRTPSRTSRRRGRPPRPKTEQWPLAITRLKRQMAETMATQEGMDSSKGRGLRLEQKRDRMTTHAMTWRHR